MKKNQHLKVKRKSIGFKKKETHTSNFQFGNVFLIRIFKDLKQTRKPYKVHDLFSFMDLIRDQFK